MSKIIIKQERYFIVPELKEGIKIFHEEDAFDEDDVIKSETRWTHMSGSGEKLSTMYNNLIIKKYIKRDEIVLWEGDSTHSYRKKEKVMVGDNVHIVKEIIRDVNGRVIYFVENQYENSPDFELLLNDCEELIIKHREDELRIQHEQAREYMESSLWYKIKQKLRFS